MMGLVIPDILGVIMLISGFFADIGGASSSDSDAIAGIGISFTILAVVTAFGIYSASRRRS